jgi:hypothetical protein
VTQDKILTLASTAEGRAVIADWYEEKGRLDVARLYRDELPPREGLLRRKVESLTDEEREQLDEYARRWIAVGRCTQPTDREKAEAALLACYRLSGLEPPKRLIWASSPPEACVGGAMEFLRLYRESSPMKRVTEDGFVRRVVSSAGEWKYILSRSVLQLPVTAAQDAVSGHAREDVGDVGFAVSDAVRALMQDALSEAMVKALDSIPNYVEREVTCRLWWRYIGAQLWSGLRWLGPAAVSYALDALRLDIGRDLELRARAYAALCESCFLIWPHKEFAVLCERPRVLELSGPGETVEQMRRQRLIRAAWEGWEVTA